MLQVHPARTSPAPRQSAGLCVHPHLPLSGVERPLDGVIVAKRDELLFFAVYVTSVALNTLFEGDVCWPVWFPFLLRRVDHVYDVGRRPFRREQNGTTKLPLP